jgi:hypothetical protein
VLIVNRSQETLFKTLQVEERKKKYKVSIQSTRKFPDKMIGE